MKEHGAKWDYALGSEADLNQASFSLDYIGRNAGQRRTRRSARRFTSKRETTRGSGDGTSVFRSRSNPLRSGAMVKRLDE